MLPPQFWEVLSVDYKSLSKGFFASLKDHPQSDQIFLWNKMCKSLKMKLRFHFVVLLFGSPRTLWALISIHTHWRPGHEKCYQIFSGFHKNVFLRSLEIHFTFDIWSKNPSIIMKSWLKVTKVDPKNTKNRLIYVFKNFSGRTWEAPLSHPLKYINRQTCLYV